VVPVVPFLFLRGSAALIARAAALVTNDSAPLHLATAVGTPVVALFGPTVPAFGFGPRGLDDVVLEHDGLACRPCSAHGPRRCPLGHHRCMRELPPGAVAAALAAVLGAPVPGRVLVDLPEATLPDWAAGVRLGGEVTLEGVLGAVYAGLQLATILACVGAANALANPKRLLRSVPPALYEIGSALVVAVTVLPQLADSLRRVRAAQTLRGGHSGRVRGLRRILVPVLEDALERSLALAASMDARGYGRAGAASPAAPAARRTSGFSTTRLASFSGELTATHSPSPARSAPKRSSR
jgi:hypothetical protein